MTLQQQVRVAPVEPRSADSRLPPDNAFVPRRRDTFASAAFMPGWPLILALVGMPLWWVLGLTQFIFFIAAVPMTVYLLQIRRASSPVGFGIWLLFLVWLLVGAFVIHVDAPGALRGQGVARYFTFTYRFGWYAVATIAMLYVANTRHFLSSRRIAGALGWVFLTLVAGGYLGILLPTLEFPTAIELALPTRLTEQLFVRDLVHAQTAQIQGFTGTDEARPSAPFTYTNLWGLNLALTLPFFVAEWWQRGGRWRTAVPVLLVIAAVPVIASLNRGLWGAILVIFVFYAVRTALKGRVAVLVGLVVVGSLAAIAIIASPLGDVITVRLENPHSNEGRGNLGALAVQSTLEGSPVIGYGTTREVDGNFNSITGGETESCPRCSPPPLGTQGQLWLLIFGSGFAGLVLYLSFFGRQLMAHYRDSSAYSVAGMCSILVLLVTMPVYNSAGFGVYVALIAVGLMSRQDERGKRPHLGALLRQLTRNFGLLTASIVLGAVAGLMVQLGLGTPVTASQNVLVPVADLTGVPESRPLTLDNEAMIATSVPVLRAVRQTVDGNLRQVRNRMSVGAEPNSRILTLSYVDTDGAKAREAVKTAADTYLRRRAMLVNAASTSLETRLAGRQVELEGAYAEALASLDVFGDEENRGEQAIIARLTRLRANSQLTIDQAQSQTAGGPPGRTLSAVSTSQTRDRWFVRTGSGAALGGLVGLWAMRVTDRRRHCLGGRPDKKLAAYDLPVVAKVAGDAVRQGRAEGLLIAQRAATAYLPLAGILSDSQSELSVRLANSLDTRLDSVKDYDGKRVLLVAEKSSRLGDVVTLSQLCERMGTQPVGIILVR